MASLPAAALVIYAVIESWQWFAAPFPGFFLMENRVVPTVGTYRWPLDRSALFHSQVVKVDGLDVRSSREVYEHVASLPLNSPIEYEFRKNGEVFHRTIPSRRFATGDYLQTCGVMLVCGCLWLGFGLTVGALQPRTAQARVFLLQGIVAGLYPVTAVFLHRPGLATLTPLYFLLECLFPATWIHLAMVFPVERRPGRWWLAPYGLSAVLLWFVLTGFYADPPNLRPLYATYLYAAASFVFFVGALAFAYRENREPRVRPRLKAVLPGAMLAGTLAFFALVDSVFGGREIPVQFGLLLAPVFSACVAYAIARHDLFDIDRLVRQTFVYALLSIIIVAAYALTLTISSRLFPAFVGDEEVLVGMLFVIGLALVLDPLRRAVQRAIDRAFYRGRLDYRATIEELTRIMATLLDPQEIVAQVTRVLTRAMQLETTTVCLLEPDGHESTVWVRRRGCELERKAGTAAVAALARCCEAHPEEFLPEAIVERLEDPQTRHEVQTFLTGVESNVVLPILFQERSVGVLALGPKRSGQALGFDDISLLRTLANQTAIASQNARSYAQLEALNRDLDAKVAQQTEELRGSRDALSHAYEELKSAQAQLVQSEKMASLGQLVAGVAHELNNPASFVHGGLANLREYARRLVEVLSMYERLPIGDEGSRRALERAREDARLDYVLREMPELLRICAEGSERIKKIVDDLRVFARADRGQRAPTEIAASIDGSLRLLGDRLRRAEVAVRKTYAAVPLVEADAAQLNQAWMNLLANAIDAVEGCADAKIDIVVRAVASRAGCPNGQCVEVSVSDNGVGIGPKDRERIFDPFFTTKPVGRGTGLGLSIVYGAVHSHGGTIDVDSEEGRGTTVTVCIPVSSLGS